MSAARYENIADEPHALRVLSYDTLTGDHVCRFDDPRSTVLGTVRIDLMTDGTLRGTDPQSLIGKLVEVQYSYPFTYIASEPRLVQGSSGRL